MRFLSIPAVTKACVSVLVFASLLVFFLRLNTYYKLLAAAQAPQIQPETDVRPVPKPTLPVFHDIVVPYISLIPSLSIIYPWVLMTTSFVETSAIGFVATFLTLIYGGRYCERVWSSKELAKFLLIVGIGSNVAAWLTALLQYTFANTIPTHFVYVKKDDTLETSPQTLEPVSSEFYLLQAVNGGIAFQLAFLVALKQLVPEHSIVLFRGLFSLKVKHLVMPALFIYTLIGVFYYYDFPFVSQIWAGFFVSWIYLRFYRYTYIDPILPLDSSSSASSSSVNSNGVSMKSSPGKTRIRGDASEVFSLANFFYPALIRDLIQKISSIVFTTLVAVKVCTPFGDDEVEQSNLRASIRLNGGPGKGGAAALGGASGGLGGNNGGRTYEELESERRRAIALKALDQKINSASKS